MVVAVVLSLKKKKMNLKMQYCISDSLSNMHSYCNLCEKE